MTDLFVMKYLIVGLLDFVFGLIYTLLSVWHFFTFQKLEPLYQNFEIDYAVRFRLVNMLLVASLVFGLVLILVGLKGFLKDQQKYFLPGLVLALIAVAVLVGFLIFAVGSSQLPIKMLYDNFP